MSATYWLASSRASTAAGSASRTSTIQPSPYGSLFTSSGLPSSASLRATTTPDTGAYTSEALFVDARPLGHERIAADATDRLDDAPWDPEGRRHRPRVTDRHDRVRRLQSRPVDGHGARPPVEEGGLRDDADVADADRLGPGVAQL